MINQYSYTKTINKKEKKQNSLALRVVWLKSMTVVVRRRFLRIDAN
jgi:hypothetical protein